MSLVLCGRRLLPGVLEGLLFPLLVFADLQLGHIVVALARGECQRQVPVPEETHELAEGRAHVHRHHGHVHQRRNRVDLEAREVAGLELGAQLRHDLGRRAAHEEAEAHERVKQQEGPPDNVIKDHLENGRLAQRRHPLQESVPEVRERRRVVQREQEAHAPLESALAAAAGLARRRQLRDDVARGRANEADERLGLQRLLAKRLGVDLTKARHGLLP
mmetsp:Transcript_38588/g.120831  ORF Transcript_38588/g.120831 Transcript_38588/m.120831 type:complete len:218 (-) Transcript_38588:247-900(-)